MFINEPDKRVSNKQSGGSQLGDFNLGEILDLSNPSERANFVQGLVPKPHDDKLLSYLYNTGKHHLTPENKGFLRLGNLVGYTPEKHVRSSHQCEVRYFEKEDSYQIDFIDRVDKTLTFVMDSSGELKYAEHDGRFIFIAKGFRDNTSDWELGDKNQAENALQLGLSIVHRATYWRDENRQARSDISLAHQELPRVMEPQVGSLSVESKADVTILIGRLLESFSNQDDQSAEIPMNGSGRASPNKRPESFIDQAIKCRVSNFIQGQSEKTELLFVGYDGALSIVLNEGELESISGRKPTNKGYELKYHYDNSSGQTSSTKEEKTAKKIFGKAFSILTKIPLEKGVDTDFQAALESLSDGSTLLPSSLRDRLSLVNELLPDSLDSNNKKQIYKVESGETSLKGRFNPRSGPTLEDTIKQASQIEISIEDEQISIQFKVGSKSLVFGLNSQTGELITVYALSSDFGERAPVYDKTGDYKYRGGDKQNIGEHLFAECWKRLTRLPSHD